MGAQRDTGREGIMYFSIHRGRFTQESTEGAEGAIRRDWELQTGEKGTKWEIPYKYIEGFLQDIVFVDGKFGEQIEVYVVDGEDVMLARMGTDTRFFSDLAKKLPNIDLDKMVKIAPFDFESKKTGKSVTGLSITQDGEKVYSYYYDNVKKVNINGLPDVTEEDRETYDKDDWKIFFMQEKKFLKKAVQAVEFPGVNSEEDTDQSETDSTEEKEAPPTKSKKKVDEAPKVDENDDLPF